VRTRTGPLRTSLFWRVFAINASLLVLAALLVGLTPLTFSAPLALRETAVLTVGLALMLAANLALLRPTFAPLERLAQRMRHVDLLRPGQRLAVSGRDEVATLVRAFNEMLDRLEAERRESGGRALAAQESERARIARGLHDEVGGTMTSVLLQLKRVEAVVPADQRADLAEAQQSVREALAEVRRIAQELRPEMLEHLGLVSALTSLATTFARRTGLTVERRFVRSLPPLDPEVELAVYRVAQESLTNVMRHSGATEAFLGLEQVDGGLRLIVRDNGRGLSADGTDAGAGIAGMSERALHVGGRLAIGSSPDSGTEVRLDIPVPGAHE
jgi:two-component system sensor histidine kinase UhpB